jgi:hypothetical protein
MKNGIDACIHHDRKKSTLSTNRYTGNFEIYYVITVIDVSRATLYRNNETSVSCGTTWNSEMEILKNLLCAFALSQAICTCRCKCSVWPEEHVNKCTSWKGKMDLAAFSCALYVSALQWILNILHVLMYRVLLKVVQIF